MNTVHRRDLIGLFAQHPVASNLLMIGLLLVGAWSLAGLNRQFFPNFALDVVSIRVVWTGASAEDVERSIIDPLEQELRSVDGLKKLTSTASNGIASITVEYHDGTEMGGALDLVKERVSRVRQLPAEAEEPEITLLIRYEPIARVLVTGPAELSELRPLVHAMERELLGRGIARVTITGLPAEEIAILVPASRLHELGLSLDRIAAQVRAASQDLPAGTVGRADAARQLRSLGQRRRAEDFESLYLTAGQDNRLLRLGDIATVERRPRDKQVSISHNGRPAVELTLLRAENSDSLDAAAILEQWAAETTRELPAGTELVVFDQTWQLIKQRIYLLLKNGMGGLALVLAILFLFLNGRVALWVAIGIPVSFMATLAALYAFGGSINMISMFALIMALGIIVDDAIVVGEDALAHYQFGEASLEAAEGGARRMLAPVFSSSLTTIAAFLPLMLVGGIIGNILSAIPFVIVCVIVASLIECFLILPGHLRHAFRHIHHRPARALRRRMDAGFEHFRNRHFRRLAAVAVDNRWITVSSAVSILVLCIGLLAGGRIGFTFFPNVESNVVLANVAFVAGTPADRVQRFLNHAEAALWETDRALGGGLVVTASTRHGTQIASDDRPSQRGDQFGAIMVELVPSDSRAVRNEDFIRAWSERVTEAAGTENLSIASRRAGHPGKAINVRLTGAGPLRLKAAAVELVQTLQGMPGIGAVEDDMPWGQEQLIYRLTAQGQAMGLSIESIGRQLRAAFDGDVAQIFYDGDDELEVRVLLTDRERGDINRLDDLDIILPSGNAVPLATVVTFDSREGFETLRHHQAALAVQVFADVDRRVANENRVRAELEAGILKDLRLREGIASSFEGKASDQRETMADMREGLVIALILIYLILAWVFASYGWPLVVMATIPFGLVGAVVGHYVMGIELTIFSLFGLFGLAGIVVNDSIILVTFYKHLREEGLEVRDAIIEAACQRLRAVLLTSLTTIAGLTPLLFETSLQAQFLIPMAISISFGLAFATLLVLLVIPSLLAIHEGLVAGRHRPAPILPAQS